MVRLRMPLLPSAFLNQLSDKGKKYARLRKLE